MVARRWSIPAIAAWAVLAFVVTVGIGILGVSKAPATPFDEAAHLDYIDKLAHGDLPEVYEPYGQTVLGELACDKPRGEAWAGLEPCGSRRYTPGLAPFGGLSTATNYAPTYYAVTAVPYRICELTTDLHARVCGRLANTLWLGAAAAGFLTLMTMLGSGILVALLVSVGSSVSPAILLQGITVNPDAAVQAMVAWLAVLALWLATGSRIRAWRQLVILGVAGAVAVTAKETALVGYVVVLLMYGFLSGRGRPRADRLRHSGAIAATLVAVVGVAALSRIAQPVLRGTGGVNTLEDLSKVPLSSLDDGVLGGLTASMAPFTQLVWAPLAGPYLYAVTALATYLAWGLALQIRLPDTVRHPVEAVPAAPRALTRESSFPVLAVLVAWLVPGALVVLTWLSSRSIPFQQRYYIATATLLLVLGTATTTNRWIRWTSAAVMGLTTVMVVQSLLAT